MMQHQVHLFLGKPAAIGGEGRFGLILANIFLNPLLDLAADLARYLAVDGQLIVSGIQESDEAELAGAFQSYGLAPRGRHRDKGWTALRLARSAD
jgi:ribosomal protein L11 methyltransferase